ncbi:MAG: hypothetical protein JWM10_1225, partial [Myxococcaceae bacterium]|nr:hypothetical protein [Myxococcaceae bacterium]
MPSDVPANDRNPTQVAALRPLLTPRGPDPSTLVFAVVTFFVGRSVDQRVHWALSRSLTHDGDAAVRSAVLALALGAIVAAACRVRRLRWAVVGLFAGCLAVTTFLGSEQAGRLVGWTMGSAMIH